jgi:hypothetical protein
MSCISKAKIALTQNDTNKNFFSWRLGVFNLWEMRWMAMCREARVCRVSFREPIWDIVWE